MSGINSIPDLPGWLEAGEARCKAVRVDGFVSSGVQSRS